MRLFQNAECFGWDRNDLLTTLCVSFTTFENGKLEWRGTPLTGALLTPVPGHLWGWLVASKLNSLSSEKSPTTVAGHILTGGQRRGRGGPISSHVCRVSLQTAEECPGSAPVLLRLSLSPSSPAPSSPPSPLSPVLFACLVLTLFCLIARRISLCPHVFPGFVPPGLLLILQFSLLHAGPFNIQTLHGSSVTLGYRYYLYLYCWYLFTYLTST